MTMNRRGILFVVFCVFIFSLAAAVVFIREEQLAAPRLQGYLPSLLVDPIAAGRKAAVGALTGSDAGWTESNNRTMAEWENVGQSRPFRPDEVSVRRLEVVREREEQKSGQSKARLYDVCGIAQVLGRDHRFHTLLIYTPGEALSLTSFFPLTVDSACIK